MAAEPPIMRWMTMAWWRGDVPDSTAEGYEEYFRSIREQLPAELRDFHERVTLHDANLLSITVELAGKTVLMAASGYQWDASLPPATRCKWFLSYEGVESVRTTATSDGGLGGPAGYGDLGYDELSLASEGFYRHAMLFSTSIELEITFRKLSVRSELI